MTTKQDAREERRRTISARARLLAEQQIRDEGDIGVMIWVSIGLIGLLWGLGVAWLCAEQTRLARHLGFELPYALPAIVDGSMFAAALFATAIAMSGRSSSSARTFSFIINLGSASTNGFGAWIRSHNYPTVVIAASVPIVLMWLFHLVLSEIRLRIRIQRGLPSEIAPPALRVLRILFAGRWAVTEWRAAGFAITDPLPQLPPDVSAALDVSAAPKSIVSEPHNPASKPSPTSIPTAPVIQPATQVLEFRAALQAAAFSPVPTIQTRPPFGLDAPAPVPLPEYPEHPSESSPAQGDTATTPPALSPGRPGYWPLEFAPELADALAQKRVNPNAPVVAAIARRAQSEGLIATSDLNGARKIVRRWLANYEASMVITESE